VFLPNATLASLWFSNSGEPKKACDIEPEVVARLLQKETAMSRLAPRAVLIALILCTASWAVARPLGYRKGLRVPMKGNPMVRDLRAITYAPDGRDPHKRTYRSTAAYVAGRLRAQGVKPLHKGRRGATGYLQTFSFNTTGNKRVTTYNVVGIREGSGPTKKGRAREAILVMGHLDGLATKDKVDFAKSSKYRGANDNASGVAAALYVSQALARHERVTGKKLKRDVVFMFSSAEEQGCIGTEAFAKFTKQFGKTKFVGAVNLDMVATGDKLYVHGGRTNSEAKRNPIYRRAMAMNKKRGGTKLLAGQSHEKAFTASDNWVTATGGIPSVFLTTGSTPTLHTTKDTYKSLNPRMHKKAARKALRLVHSLATAPRSPSRGRTFPLKLKGFIGWGDKDLFPGKGPKK